MKILVTGAEGFTGHYFVEAAKAKACEIAMIKSDLRDYASLKDEVLAIEPDAVVHLAAISFVGHGNWADFYTVNVVGTVNLLNALCALKKPPESVLVASSANVYGNSQASPVAESEPCVPLNDYAVSKVAMEYAANLFRDRLPILITRPFNYTGRGQNVSFLIPKLVKHFIERKQTIELGNLDVARDFLDVRVLVDVYLQLLEKRIANNVVNVCSGITYSLSDILDRLQSMSGHKIEVRVNPQFVRQNELKILCGDSAKLKSLGIHFHNISFDETLKWMLTGVTV